MMSVVVLCHKRTWHLQRVLDALFAVENVDTLDFIFVAQDSPIEVIEIIDQFKVQKKTIIRVEGEKFSSAAAAINSNLFQGLSTAFENKKSKSCLVIEDDIIVSPDILTFFSESLEAFGQQSRFRGAMAYSINRSAEFTKGDVVKLNFGIGFGWLITDSIYKELLKFWTGKEQTHWDYWIEPYLRTGFIVAPLYSRVRNIGFDETATHASEYSEFGSIMEQSFGIGQEKSYSKVKEVRAPYSHSRRDICIVSNLNYLERIALYVLRDLAFRIYKLAINNRSRTHYAWRVLRNFTDTRFSNIQVVDQY